MRDWIDCKVELPSVDGEYLFASGNPLEDFRYPILSGIYDGYGFKYEGRYVRASFWHKCEPPVKRYGKVK